MTAVRWSCLNADFQFPRKAARKRSAVRLGMNRYAPALTVTKRGSAAVRTRNGRRGIVMWLDV